MLFCGEESEMEKKSFLGLHSPVPEQASSYPLHHRIQNNVGRLWKAQVQRAAPSRSNYVGLLRAMFGWGLNTCKDGDPTVTLVPVPVCVVKNLFSYKMESLRKTDFKPWHFPVIILNPYFFPQCQNIKKKNQEIITDETKYSKMKWKTFSLYVFHQNHTVFTSFFCFDRKACS